MSYFSNNYFGRVMKKFFLICVAIFLAVILYSCSDDSAVNPEETGTFKPFLSIGNQWIYGTYKLDDNNNETGSLLRTYASKVVDRTTIDGKGAYTVITEFSKSGTDKLERNYIDTSYFSADGNDLYTYSDKNNFITLPKGWVKVIDTHNLSWTVFSFDIDTVEGSTTIKGTSELKAQSMGTSEVMYNGNEYEAKNYSYVFYYKIAITDIDKNGVPSTNVFENTSSTTLSYIPEIGIYSITGQALPDIGLGYYYKKKSILMEHQVK